MDAVNQILAWIGEHEAVLSGIAATIAILPAISSRAMRLFRSRRGDDTKSQETPKSKIPQKISYCQLENGVRLAWSSAGSGYPLIRSLGWFTNLEMEWDSPVSSAFWQKLARHF